MTEGQPGPSILDIQRESIRRRFDHFKEQAGISHIVSVSGSADANHTGQAVTYLAELCRELQGQGIGMLTGGTEGGIPELGLKVAREYHLPTLGVYPPRAREKGYVVSDLIDFPLESFPPAYGNPGFSTETPTFAQLTDFAVILGGGPGTLTEVATIMKINDGRLKKGEKPIYIIPILGSTGIADLIPTLATMFPTIAPSVVPNIRTGKDAGAAIRQKI